MTESQWALRLCPNQDWRKMMREIINTRDTMSSAFTSHNISSGKSGSGKTNGKEFLLENYHLFGKRKCMDFDNSSRYENCSYSIAEDKPNLIRDMNEHPDLVQNFDLKPMAFQSEILMICGRGLFH